MGKVCAPLRKNETYELEITSISNLGFGVSRYEKCVVFVRGGVTGDRAEVKIIKTTPSYAVGIITRLISPSKKRCSDRCDSIRCTSCAYKTVIYSHETEIKENDVKAAFLKAGLADVEIEPIITSPATARYRNKAQYPVAMDKNGYTVGFYAPKSHNVTEARACPLAPTEFEQIINTLVVFFERYALSVYDEESGKGLLRHIYLRRGEVSGEILLTLVINGNNIPAAGELVKLITEAYPTVVGILLNVNEKKTNVILGDEYITLFGRDYIYDTLSGVKLKITAPSFYQVNHDAAELLYKKAAELAQPRADDVMLDLYCGAGSIGLSMANKVRELIGIEIVESAVECAKENAADNGITNASFYTGDAKDTQKLLENAERSLGRKIKPTLVLLDPPRAGCSEELIKYVAALAPERVVYISCNPTTLARDSVLFRSLGYQLGKVTPVDMFPGTGHVESVVCLTRTFDN